MALKSVVVVFVLLSYSSVDARRIAKRGMSDAGESRTLQGSGRENETKPGHRDDVCCCKSGPCRDQSASGKGDQVEFGRKAWPMGSDFRWAVQSDTSCCKEVYSPITWTCAGSGYGAVPQDHSKCQVSSIFPSGWWIVYWQPLANVVSFKKQSEGKVVATPGMARQICTGTFLKGFKCREADDSKEDQGYIHRKMGTVVLFLNPISMLYYNPITGYYHDPEGVGFENVVTYFPDGHHIAMHAGEEPMYNGFPRPGIRDFLFRDYTVFKVTDDKALALIPPPSEAPRTEGVDACVEITCGNCLVSSLQCKVSRMAGVVLPDGKATKFSADYKRILSGSCEAAHIWEDDAITRSPTACTAEEVQVIKCEKIIQYGKIIRVSKDCLQYPQGISD